MQSYEQALQHEQFEPETPFLDSPVITREAFERTPAAFELESPWAQNESPFQRDQFLAEGEDRELTEALAEVLESLRDEQFDQALYEMAARAESLVSEGFTSSYLSPEQREAELDRMLTQHFAPLADEAHRMYDRMMEGLQRQDLEALSENDLEALLDQFAPDYANLAPEQQAFLGGVFKKVKQGIKGVANLAKKGLAAVGKVALGPLLGKLKALVNPLLQRVIRFAIKRLPPKVQPIARTLAKKILGVNGEVTEYETEGAAREALAVESPAGIQHEYDLLIVDSMLSSEELDSEVLESQFARPEPEGEDPVERFYEAREELVENLSRLEAGADPTPAIQQFLPAALIALQPIIRTVIGIIGREKVVDFLAGLLAKLVSRWIGEQPAKALAAPLVSTGLGLLGFETARDPRRHAADVLAQTLQETVLSLAQQPESVFESPALTQVAAQEAFEAAAAANFPASVLRPELRQEHDAPAGNGATWVTRPANQRRKYYKKSMPPREVTLTKALAQQIQVFGGATLADHLETTRFFEFRQPLRVKVHLYELALGARLADIAVREAGVNGLGSWSWESWSQILPLTPEAATALLGSPALGKAVDKLYLLGPYLVTAGQRFYFLEFPAPVKPKKNGKSNAVIANQACPGNRVGLVVDIPKERLVIKMRLTEAHAQRVAQAIKQNDIAGALHTLQVLRDVIRGLLTGATTAGLTVIRPVTSANELFEGQAAVAGAGGAAAGAAATGAAESAASWLLKKIGDKLFDLVWKLIENYFRNKGQEFMAAANDPADGVTVFITFSNLKPLSVAREVMLGNYARAALALAGAQIPYPSIYTAKGCLA
jgi:hypothetical protein